MKRNDLPRAVRKRWTDRYISALLDSIGAATILGLREDCKLLHDLTKRAAGLTNGAESDTMKPSSPKRAEQEEKTMTITINITQDAYINNGEYRLHTDSGAPSVCVLREWYEAAAEDADGNEYKIIWSVRDDWDSTSGDESDACNWDSPEEVIRLDSGENITSRAKINW